MLGLLTCLVQPDAGLAGPPSVKQSSSGICHDAGSPWYERTKSFVPFDDMKACLVTGRTYSGYVPQVEDPGKAAIFAPESVDPKRYDRALYGSWIDSDGDCQNTRQELLAELSTAAVTWNEKGCTANVGRWLDPYSGKLFTNARDLDIDHLVPLAYAHARGAALWSEDKRRAFANDPRNLFAVEAGLNRSKGAQGPTDWMPPSRDFQCQYLLRFDRIMKTYGLRYTEVEAPRIAALRARTCPGS